MEAVLHRHEGAVSQVMGDGINALFGAPLAQDDHAVRASYAGLRMWDAVKRYAEDVRRRAGVVRQSNQQSGPGPHMTGPELKMAAPPGVPIAETVPGTIRSPTRSITRRAWLIMATLLGRSACEGRARR
jgi:hypothetical protein